MAGDREHDEGDAASGTGTNANLKANLNMGQKIGKFTLMAVNVLFLIFGCVLCAVGAYALNNEIAQLIGATLPEGIIVVGSFLLLLSIIGYVSAWKEFRVGLAAYFFFISIITVILFAVGIAVYVKQNQVDVYISEAWIAASDDTRAALQIAFNCCGLNSFNTSDPYTVYRYPCDGSLKSSDVVPTEACMDLMVTSFKSNFNTAGACGIAFSCVMIVSLAFTAYLMVGIRESAVNKAIEKNRARNERDMTKNRRKGKGLKIPQIGTEVL